MVFLTGVVRGVGADRFEGKEGRFGERILSTIGGCANEDSK